MICKPCKENEHEKCPSKQSYNDRPDPSAPGSKILKTRRASTGLGPENEAVQRSGLCPCQHRAPRVFETGEFHEAIRRANAKMVAVGLTPSPFVGVA